MVRVCPPSSLSPRRRLTRFLSPCSCRSAVVPFVNIGTHSAANPDLRHHGFNVGSCCDDSNLSPLRFQFSLAFTPKLPSTFALCRSPQHLQVSKSYAKHQPRREQWRLVSAHRRTS